MQISVREPRGAEDAALGALMFDAIHRGPSLYSAAERAAWLAAPNEGPAWSARLSAQHVVVARACGVPVGFITLKEDYIDLAYVAATAQGLGVFRALYTAIEDAAARQKRLWTHASLMAQPAFLAVGFHVIQHETVARNGEHLRRAEMEKVLL